MNRTHKTSKSALGRLSKGLVVALGALVVLGSTGCDDLLLSGLPNAFFPSTSLYDPTDIIQDVISYRQGVMDWSNQGWSDYILQ